MFRKTRITSISLTVMITSLIVWGANAVRSPYLSIASEMQNSFQTVTPPHKAEDSALVSSPCMNALAQHAVCITANKRSLEVMNANRLKAIIVVQDVRTGALVAFAASHPSELDVTTPVGPLSLSKVLLSASWWDNRQPDSSFDSTKGSPNAQNPAYRSRVTVHEMLVGGSDSAGRQLAVALRRSVGTKKVLEDFARYGFGRRTGLLQDDKFWGEQAPPWKARLIPVPAYVSLSEETKDGEWAETLSLGEINISLTALHISRFLQAVGNNGVMLTPVAREEQSTPSVTKSAVSRRDFNNSIRVMQESTALRLQSAMCDTVQRGTAKSIAKTLEDTGWQIGGKTGSGPALLPKGDLVDGWFAGLVFDPQGKARFTVVTFVRSGGYGGENAAKISAELARYIIGGQPRSVVNNRRF
ncbi:MAG TPA: penicillin-binding transpeptidase domain-containing protein [Pyrinomonadaceae bacterium]|nr:penicillin-binding transpeptidase domain-containing protein [Pyrinomonadaceae bacterium]